MNGCLQLHGFPPSDKYYDFPCWASALDCNWGLPVGRDGRFLAMEMLDRVGDYVMRERTHLLSSSFRIENACSRWTDRIALKGDLSRTTNICAYGSILAPLVWYLCPYLQWLKRAHPDVRLILVEDDAFQEVTLYHPSLATCVYETIMSADAVLCYSHDMYRWINGFHPTSAEVVLPLPLEFAHTAGSCSERSDVSLGILSWNYDLANLHANCLAFSGVPSNVRERYNVQIVGAREAKWYSFRDLSQLSHEVPSLQVCPWKQGNFYSFLARHRLVIHLTRRVSLARYSAQCAWTGTPIVGNANCTWQQRLWPECSVLPHQVRKAQELASRILEDDEFYRDLVAEAWERLQVALRGRDADAAAVTHLLSGGGAS